MLKSCLLTQYSLAWSLTNGLIPVSTPKSSCSCPWCIPWSSVYPSWFQIHLTHETQPRQCLLLFFSSSSVRAGAGVPCCLLAGRSSSHRGINLGPHCTFILPGHALANQLGRAKCPEEKPGLQCCIIGDRQEGDREE